MNVSGIGQVMVSGNGQQATMLASRPGQTQVLMPAGPQ